MVRNQDFLQFDEVCHLSINLDGTPNRGSNEVGKARFQYWAKTAHGLNAILFIPGSNLAPNIQHYGSSGLSRSMPNADQCRSKLWQSALIGNGRQWEALTHRAGFINVWILDTLVTQDFSKRKTTNLSLLLKSWVTSNRKYVFFLALTLLRFSGVFSDPGGGKSFLILLSVGYFCQISYVFAVGSSVRVWGLKEPMKTSNVSIGMFQHVRG